MDLTAITMTALTHPFQLILVAVAVRSALGLLFSGRSFGSIGRAPIAAMHRQPA